jgi:hypothetical protein
VFEDPNKLETLGYLDQIYSAEGVAVQDEHLEHFDRGTQSRSAEEDNPVLGKVK